MALCCFQAATTSHHVTAYVGVLAHIMCTSADGVAHAVTASPFPGCFLILAVCRRVLSDTSRLLGAFAS